MKLTDESIMPVGKHKGKPMQDVPAEHLIYIYENVNCFGNIAVKNYIAENIEYLQMEVVNNSKNIR